MPSNKRGTVSAEESWSRTPFTGIFMTRLNAHAVDRTICSSCSGIIRRHLSFRCALSRAPRFLCEVCTNLHGVPIAPPRDQDKPRQPKPPRRGGCANTVNLTLNHHPVCGVKELSRFFLMPQPPLLARRGKSAPCGFNHTFIDRAYSSAVEPLSM